MRPIFFESKKMIKKIILEEQRMHMSLCNIESESASQRIFILLFAAVATVVYVPLIVYTVFLNPLVPVFMELVIAFPVIFLIYTFYQCVVRIYAMLLLMRDE